MDHPIQARRLDLILIDKKERTCHFTDVAVSADHRAQVKECEKLNKYLDLAREQKKLCNMKMTVIPIILVTLGTIPKNMEKGPDEQEIR